MTDYGYARVSRVDQDPELQFTALSRAGITDDHLYVERASGAQIDRPVLGQLLMVLEPGDSITVWKLDRLGRSTAHLLQLLDQLGELGVDFRCLTEAIDTRTAGGRLVFTMLAAVAQFERDLNRERTAAALAAARERGVRLGRRPRITPGQWETITELHRRGLSHRAIADRTGVPRTTIGRALRGDVDTINHYGQPAITDEASPGPPGRQSAFPTGATYAPLWRTQTT